MFAKIQYNDCCANVKLFNSVEDIYKTYSHIGWMTYIYEVNSIDTTNGLRLKGKECLIIEHNVVRFILEDSLIEQYKKGLKRIINKDYMMYYLNYREKLLENGVHLRIVKKKGLFGIRKYLFYKCFGNENYVIITPKDNKEVELGFNNYKLEYM